MNATAVNTKIIGAGIVIVYRTNKGEVAYSVYAIIRSAGIVVKTDFIRMFANSVQAVIIGAGYSVIRTGARLIGTGVADTFIQRTQISVITFVIVGAGACICVCAYAIYTSVNGAGNTIVKLANRAMEAIRIIAEIFGA